MFRNFFWKSLEIHKFLMCCVIIALLEKRHCIVVIKLKLFRFSTPELMINSKLLRIGISSSDVQITLPFYWNYCTMFQEIVFSGMAFVWSIRTTKQKNDVKTIRVWKKFQLALSKSKSTILNYDITVYGKMRHVTYSTYNFDAKQNGAKWRAA